jgi:hypothetical protein
MSEKCPHCRVVGKHLEPCYESIVAENSRLASALKEIAKVSYGLELGDSDEYRAEYWAKAALRYRDIAREALNPTSASPKEQE